MDRINFYDLLPVVITLIIVKHRLTAFNRGSKPFYRGLLVTLFTLSF